MAIEKSKILCIDDEQEILNGLMRQLRGRYHLTPSNDSIAALDLLRCDGPFSLVVTDMRMPRMNGAELLSNVRRISPATVGILLTGQTDIETAIAAVNSGNVFRFLTKPCRFDILTKAIEDGIEQHKLITAERVLLRQTLLGCIKMLTEILSLANPVAFGRATRLKRLVAKLTKRLEVKERWIIEIAAMLFHIGCVALPAETIEKLYYGKELSDEEQQMVNRLPEITESLLSKIPRLEKIREILKFQSKNYDGSGYPSHKIKENEIPFGARIIKVVSDFELLREKGMPTKEILKIMNGKAGFYDPKIFSTFNQLMTEDHDELPPISLTIEELESGMILAEDIITRVGVLLVPKGQEINVGLLARLRSYWRQNQIDDCFKIDNAEFVHKSG